MKERPILFSAPMVRALLDGRKTQTRRVVKAWVGVELSNRAVPADLAYLRDFTCYRSTCPYGVPGDRLWVKETFFAWGRWETRFSADKGRDEWHFVDQTIDSGRAYRYVATDEAPPLGLERQRAGATAWWWKRPAIFMPRAASRIDLGVTGVRVERLQDISEADAVAEGVMALPNHPGRWWLGFNVSSLNYPTAAAAYADLWEQINGVGTWAANPWVWVVEFKRGKP